MADCPAGAGKRLSYSCYTASTSSTHADCSLTVRKAQSACLAGARFGGARPERGVAASSSASSASANPLFRFSIFPFDFSGGGYPGTGSCQHGRLHDKGSAELQC